MNDLVWQELDAYIEQTALRTDHVFEEVLQRQRAAGLPAIAVSPAQGKFLQLLAHSTGARRILEVGTLGGYSAIWMVRALPPDGKLITLELDPLHARVARENFSYAGVAHAVELLEGPALDSLDRLPRGNAARFDFTFIDADKSSIPEYFERAIALSRPGALIVVDNVVRRGALIQADSTDPSVRGVRRLHEMLARDRRVDATTIQTVGAKGYDGFTLARVL